MRRVACLILVLLIAAPVIAQEEEEEVTIEDIFDLVAEGKVVTATKTQRLLKTAPQAVTVITRKQIKEMGATTIAEVLRFVPGTNIRLTPMGSVIGIRSFGPSPFTERVLLLIDGTPYNSPDKGGFPGHPAYEDFFPIEQIKRIEVIKGPGSALYGQNAFFGIVNIISEDFKEEGTRAAVVSGGSRDTARVAISSGGQSDNGDWAYSLTGKYKQQDGPMFFNQDTDVKSGDFYIKTRYRDFSLAYLFHKDQSDTFNIAPTTPAGIPTLETDQTLNFIDATYDRKVSEQWNWRVKGFFNRRNGNTCENCHNPLAIGRPNVNLEEEDEVNQRLFFNTQLDYNMASHKIIFGLDVQSDRTEKDIVLIANADETINTYAGYAQGEFTLANGKAIATVGVRLDHNEVTDNSVSPSASLVVLPNDKFVFRTSYGRAFRQPTWNDLFISMKFNPGAFPDIRMVGNPDLDTEKIDTFQAGVEYFFSPDFSAKGDFFYSRIQDFIQPLEFVGFPVSVATAFNRADDISSTGAEFEFRFRPRQEFSAILGYAVQGNDIDAPPGELDSAEAYAPEHKFTGIINVVPVNYLSFNFAVNYWSEFNSRSFEAGTVRFTEELGQPYTYANFKTLVTIPAGNQELGLSFTVKNLFDEELQLTPVFGVDSSLFGREYYVGLEYGF